jgi:uncharacterized protein YkwD
VRFRLTLTACLLAACLLAPALPASASANARARQVAAEWRLVGKVNEIRRGHGLRPLQVSRSLARSAGRYSRRLMVADVFGHAGRVQASSRFRRLGETLALHSGRRYKAGAVVRWWMRSPGHRTVLLDGSMRYIGAGGLRGRFRGRRAVIWTVHVGA